MRAILRARKQAKALAEWLANPADRDVNFDFELGVLNEMLNVAKLGLIEAIPADGPRHESSGFLATSILSDAQFEAAEFRNPEKALGTIECAILVLNGFYTRDGLSTFVTLPPKEG